MTSSNIEPKFWSRNLADIRPLFQIFPVMLIFLVAALTMRLWSEERRSGTIELLMTLPVPAWSAVVGKWLAAWIFSTVALMLTFPASITVNVLGDPDNGANMTGYVGGVLMAGAFLALGACVSSLTKSQVIAFVLTAVVCLFFVRFPPKADIFCPFLGAKVDHFWPIYAPSVTTVTSGTMLLNPYEFFALSRVVKGIYFTI